MHRPHLILVVACLAFLPGAVCEPGGPEPDAGVPDGSTLDMGPGEDADVPDLGDDSGTMDASTDGAVRDAEVDSGPADAGVGVDAGPCGTDCIPSDACRTAACNVASGMCVETPLEDGLPCGATDAFICVAGTCESRRCGDGYRERGSEIWPREGCDDRNAFDGDICNMSCEPTEFIPRVDLGTDEYSVRFSATGQLLVVDGLGNGLLTWVQHHVGFGDEHQELRASRIDPYGNFLDLDNPLFLDSTTLTAFDMTPSAVGLSTGGFVVAWTAQRTVANTSAFVLLMRRIAVDGSMTAQLNVHPAMIGAQRWPRLAALSDSFVVVWQDDGAESDLWGRRFRNTGGAMTTVMGLASAPAGRQSEPNVAAIGNDWMVSFLSQTGSVITSPVQIRARRFRDSGPLGNEFTVVAANATSHELSAVGGDYVLAYTSSADDTKGDLYVMHVPRSGGALGVPLALDTAPLVGAANPRIAPYGPRELGAFVVAYTNNATIPDPLFVTVGLTPPSEVSSLLLMTRGEEYPVLAAAPYALTGGSVWFGYTAQVGGGHVGAVVFQLPPP